MEGKPPFGHESACSTENFTLQVQLEGVLSGYRNAIMFCMWANLSNLQSYLYERVVPILPPPSNAVEQRHSHTHSDYVTSQPQGHWDRGGCNLLSKQKCEVCVGEASQPTER